MKFYFADSQDMVDPTFDFATETRAEWRIRQRDDLYPHEVFPEPPYDGILVSKAMVDGNGSSGGRYSLAQRQRLFRSGVRAFFRSPPALKMMGDCGAFSYIQEEYPPFTCEGVIDFYENCGFDYGISVDHVILGFKPDIEAVTEDSSMVPDEWQARQKITLELASEFLRLCRTRKVAFTPLGVAQGWSPQSYAFAVAQLQDMGYRSIALGGLVPLASSAIIQCLKAIEPIRDHLTALHLLGVTRLEHVAQFQQLGVTSIDSTSPFRQAFLDGKDNYYTRERTYIAIRVPQVDSNPQLQSRIRSGELDQEETRRMQDRCLIGLAEYDQGLLSIDDTLELVLAYESVHHPSEDRASTYREVLLDRPWASCSCTVCQHIGIHVIIFRGAERNKRRGFHNLRVFCDELQTKLRAPMWSSPESNSASSVVSSKE